MTGYVEKEFVCNDNETVVATVSGRVKGYRYDGVNTFLGVPYAQAKRFEEPQQPDPWDGIKVTQGYGYTCPLMRQKTPWSNIINPNRTYPQSEDCQVLNVWTPVLDSNAKLPVVVWIHGGGFASGSCVELTAYDGSNMAKYGDVVCVSLNHRLNVLGYLDLSEYGEAFKNSGNLGMLDIVAALKWVQQNISRFGGDPNCVTIFGQSGGGGKVSTLMQSPEADGLFHRALMMSGAGTQLCEGKENPKLAEKVLQELNIAPKDVEKLKDIPLDELFDAVGRVSAKVNMGNQIVGGIWWEPTVNDWYKGEPTRVGFTDHAKTIPLMIGTVFGEFAMRGMMNNKLHASQKEQMEHVRAVYGDDADEMVELFRKTYPDRCIADVACVDHMFRTPTIKYADRRAADGCCATYVYLNTLELPYDDGMPLWHCGDIDFFFHNAELSPLHQIPGVTSALQEQIFGAFMNFVRTGDPNGEGLPEWPEYKTGEENTLLFGKESGVRVNFDRELSAKVQKARKVAPLVDF